MIFISLRVLIYLQIVQKNFSFLIRLFKKKSFNFRKYNIINNFIIEIFKRKL